MGTARDTASSITSPTGLDRSLALNARDWLAIAKPRLEPIAAAIPAR